MVFTAIYVIYQVISLPVNFTGRGFDLAAHQARRRRPGTRPPTPASTSTCRSAASRSRCCAAPGTRWPSCSRPTPGRRRPTSWTTGRPTRPAAAAASFGFGYLRRPDLRAYKKSGNLRYAFARTSGEFIVIFDADFAPRPDFLAETLPYLDDPAIAIVQTPAVLPGSSAAQTWIENAAGAIQEVFYRSVQVARDRFGAATCVGTSAVYRRAALEPQGGPTLIPYAEDVHTGLDVRRAGWSLVYLPVVLSTGICPDNLDAFVRQQYRWCTGNAGIVFSRRLWSIPMTRPGPADLHLRVLLLRLHRPARLLRAAHPDRHAGLPARPGPAAELRHPAPRPWSPGSSSTRCGTASRYGPSVWPLGIARGWAHVFAIWDSAWGKTMSWHPTRTPGSALRRFRLWVTGWSGGTALLWAALAIWRTVTLDSAQFAVLLCFGLLNLAVVGRVIFPGRQQRHEVPASLALLAAVAIAAVAIIFAGARLSCRCRPSRRPCTRRCRRSSASYLGVYEAGAPPGYQPVTEFAQARGPAAEPGRLLQRLGGALPDIVRASRPHAHGAIPFVQIDPTYASVPGSPTGAYDVYLRSYADSVRDFGHARGHRLRARDERAAGTRGATGMSRRRCSWRRGGTS